jgi:sulfur carrier protein
MENLSSKSGIAVAVNNTVIKKTDWDQTLLGENDKILVISATKGG